MMKIKRALEKKETAVVPELLGQCQDAAIEIGMMIEAEEEGTVAVRLLEEYCEQLYQIYEAVRQCLPVNPGSYKAFW